ncbi:hypothetical protein ABEP12_02045 [Bacillus velezensis]
MKKLGELPRKPQGSRSDIKNPYMNINSEESEQKEKENKTTQTNQTEPQKKKTALKSMKVDVSIHNKIKSLHEILAAEEGDEYILEDTIEQAIDKMVETLPDDQKTFYEYILKKRSNKG